MGLIQDLSKDIAEQEYIDARIAQENKRIRDSKEYFDLLEGLNNRNHPRLKTKQPIIFPERRTKPLFNINTDAEFKEFERAKQIDDFRRQTNPTRYSLEEYERVLKEHKRLGALEEKARIDRRFAEEKARLDAIEQKRIAENLERLKVEKDAKAKREQLLKDIQNQKRDAFKDYETSKKVDIFRRENNPTRYPLKEYQNILKEHKRLGDIEESIRQQKKRDAELKQKRRIQADIDSERRLFESNRREAWKKIADEDRLKEDKIRELDARRRNDLIDAVKRDFPELEDFREQVRSDQKVWTEFQDSQFKQRKWIDENREEYKRTEKQLQRVEKEVKKAFEFADPIELMPRVDIDLNIKTMPIEFYGNPVGNRQIKNWPEIGRRSDYLLNRKTGFKSTTPIQLGIEFLSGPIIEDIVNNISIDSARKLAELMTRKEIKWTNKMEEAFKKVRQERWDLAANAQSEVNKALWDDLVNLLKGAPNQFRTKKLIDELTEKLKELKEWEQKIIEYPEEDAREPNKKKEIKAPLPEPIKPEDLPLPQPLPDVYGEKGFTYRLDYMYSSNAGTSYTNVFPVLTPLSYDAAGNPKLMHAIYQSEPFISNIFGISVSASSIYMILSNRRLYYLLASGFGYFIIYEVANNIRRGIANWGVSSASGTFTLTKNQKPEEKKTYPEPKPGEKPAEKSPPPRDDKGDDDNSKQRNRRNRIRIIQKTKGSIEPPKLPLKNDRDNDKDDSGEDDDMACHYDPTDNQRQTAILSKQLKALNDQNLLIQGTLGTPQPGGIVGLLKTNADSIFARLGEPLKDAAGNIQGISGKLTKIANAMHLPQILNIINLWLTLHNAWMLSNNLATTLFETFDNLLKVFGFALKDEEGKDLAIGDYLKKSVDSMGKEIFGVASWTSINANVAKANRIYQATANLFNTIRSIQYSILGALEAIGGMNAKIGNQLQKWGVIDGNPWFNPQPNYQNRFTTGLNNTIDTIESINMVAMETLDARENVERLFTLKDDLGKEINKGETEGKTKADTEKKANDPATPSKADFQPKTGS